MKKKLPTDQIMGDLKSGSVFFQGQIKNKKETQKTIFNNENKSIKKVAQSSAQNTEQSNAQKDEQVSKILSKIPNVEEIELLHFQLRKNQKAKVNTTIPIEWKHDLDEIAHRLKVGKYDLLSYIIGSFLGRTKHK